MCKGALGEVRGLKGAFPGAGALIRNPPKRMNWRFNMKMVKSLLLGSAAGLVAVAGAQAADLPVKAKAVEYVKVCSLYGAGFWYVPGTDTCLKIGSYIRVQNEWNANNGGTPIGSGDTAGRQDRIDTSNWGFRARQSVSVDLRTQTEYGTLRSYLEIGAQWTTTGPAEAGTGAVAGDLVFVDRGFIQFAGFTVGRIRSYFDVNSMAPYSYSNNRVNGDTGANGIFGMAYTGQFGNGVTASLSFEDGGEANGGRGRSTVNLNTFSNVTAFTGAAGGATNGGSVGPFTLGAQTTDNKGLQVPDVVGALRIDQAWGYAQVAAAIHDASGGNYSSATGSLTGSNAFGHPTDKFGFALIGGFTLNDVFGNKGDQIALQACYSEGAAGYCTRATTPWLAYSSGNSVGLGWLAEGTFINGGSVELTTVWGINGAFQHFWNPKWRTSLWGGYVEVDYSSTAKSNICPAGVGAAGFPVGFSASAGTVTNNGAFGATGVVPGGVSNCNPNYSWTQLGSRTQWNPHPDLDIGLEVLWTHLNTAFKGTGLLTASGGRPNAIYNIEDQDIVSVFFRIQRNFLP